MCDYCERDKQLLSKDIPTVVFAFSKDKSEYIGDEEIQVIIDRGYLRLGQTDDMQCMDHGEKIKINYCPMCGNKM